MTTKTCKECGRARPLGEFYRRGKGTARQSKCKECTKRAVRMHRRKSEAVRAYDRERAKLPHRKARAREIARQWRIDHPEAYRAQNALSNAIRDGKVTRFPCEVCGDPKVHGHHRDYSKPFEVLWLCPRHHHAAHGLTRAIGRS